MARDLDARGTVGWLSQLARANGVHTAGVTFHGRPYTLTVTGSGATRAYHVAGHGGTTAFAGYVCVTNDHPQFDGIRVTVGRNTALVTRMCELVRAQQVFLRVDDPADVARVAALMRLGYVPWPKPPAVAPVEDYVEAMAASNSARAKFVDAWRVKQVSRYMRKYATRSLGRVLGHRADGAEARTVPNLDDPGPVRLEPTAHPSVFLLHEMAVPAETDDDAQPERDTLEAHREATTQVIRALVKQGSPVRLLEPKTYRVLADTGDPDECESHTPLTAYIQAIGQARRQDDQAQTSAERLAELVDAAHSTGLRNESDPRPLREHMRGYGTPERAETAWRVLLGVPKVNAPTHTGWWAWREGMELGPDHVEVTMRDRAVGLDVPDDADIATTAVPSPKDVVVGDDEDATQLFL